MSSSEDCADHEFVFVGSRRATHDEGLPPGARQHRPRLCQPIPTSCDLEPHLTRHLTPTPPPHTVASRAKATPLPPELIDLLPPHLRHNTVPDYRKEDPPPPERPPLPATYYYGDYSNLEDLSGRHLSSKGSASNGIAVASSVASPLARSKSLPREESGTYISGRPRQPPAPKFARSPTRSAWAAGEPGARAWRLAEAASPTPPPACSSFRAAVARQGGSSPTPRSASAVSATSRHANRGPGRAGSSDRERSVAATPPSSPEMRRAWNVVGVPVRRSPARSSPSAARPPSSDENIYDNLVVGPSTSDIPSAARMGVPLTSKPPSPPTLRRASRSPSPGCTPSYCPAAQGGAWVPVWGSSPHLLQAGASAVYVCGGAPSPVVLENRSVSCDRLPTARPSPPPSPRSGRRSASPCPPPPAAHRPSPDRGRPPRPRRPALRKAKTVEVGCLGMVIPQPMLAPQPSPPPLGPYLPGASPPLATAAEAYYIQPADHHGIPACRKHCYSRQQHHFQNIETIPEQIGRPGEDWAQGVGVSWSCAGPAPCILPITCTPSPSPSPSPLLRPSPACVRQERQQDDAKQKVTYKSSFYKCMKSLLRPLQ